MLILLSTMSTIIQLAPGGIRRNPAANIDPDLDCKMRNAAFDFGRKLQPSAEVLHPTPRYYKSDKEPHTVQIYCIYPPSRTAVLHSIISSHVQLYCTTQLDYRLIVR